MASQDRPNYFLLLGIGVEFSWNEDAFERILRDKRNEWSRRVNVGVKTAKATQLAQAAMDQLDEIVRVMLDPALREEERSAARTEQAQQRADRFDEFQRALRIMVVKGFLFETEAARLRKDYAGVEGIEERLARTPVRAPAEEQPLPERLEPSKAATIRSLLSSVKQESLYTLLKTVDSGLGDKPELGALQAAAKKLYQQTQQTMNKQLPGLAATQELAGHAMAVFGDETNRRRYDTTLALAPLDELIRTYQSALTPLKRIDASQVEQFLADARGCGASAGVARALLVKHFTELKWTVMLPADPDGGSQENVARCGGCQAISDTSENFCVQCGAPFRATCPSCGHVGPGHGSCSRCGFPVSNQDWVRLLLRDCDELLERGELDGAKHKLTEAGNAWPMAPGSTDELRQWQDRCTAKYEELHRKREDSAREASARLLTLMESRHFMAAYRLAMSSPLPDQHLVRKEAEGHVREADRLFALAQRPGTSVQQQAAYYRQALADCADHEKSQEALRRLPPDGPRDLRLVATDGHIRLSWQPSSTEDVRYLVVRKRGTWPPTSFVDGTRIATVAALDYTDRSPLTGVALHYAVFADRGGTVSMQGAATTTATFLTDEVTVTARAVDDGVVTLEWTLPPHAYGVAISRSISGGNMSVDVRAEPNVLRDKGLTNGVSYTYLLRAEYRDDSGATVRSPGTSITITPGRPPALPEAVRVRTVDQSIKISYRYLEISAEPVGIGTVGLLWSMQQPGVRAGDTIDANDLAPHGSLLEGAAARTIALFNPGLYYFVSVVLLHGLAYIGGVRRYAAVPEVGALTADGQENSVRLRWTWPDDCEAVLVAYDHTGWPADPTVATYQRTVTRHEYERGGCYDVPVAGTQTEVFLLIAVLVHRGDEAFVSSGVRCRTSTTGTRLRVDYDITAARRQNRIQLRASAPVTLPGLTVVANPTHLPTDRHDGTVLYEQGPVTVKRTHAFVVPAQGKRLFARVFLVGGGDTGITIVTPAAERSMVR